MKNIMTDTIQLGKEEFKSIAYKLVDELAEFYENIPQMKVTTGESPGHIREILGNDSLPENGIPAADIMKRASELLLQHSLLNGHPKFFGYITSSPTQIGALSDLLAAAVNPNVGANILSPMATQIEKQTIQWLAEFIGVSKDYGGILVSGGNMANFTAFLAARTAKAPETLKKKGLTELAEPLMMYCSQSTHSWIEKAAILFGHGTDAIRWIPTDEHLKMRNDILEQTIKEDIENHKKPFLVVGTAGDVSAGVVDDLSGIAAICKTYDMWFHIDGAYGIPAVVLPDLKDLFTGMTEADSIALDPHKWLYAPLEAGCTLVKNPKHLSDAFSQHPVYYNFAQTEDEPALNFYEYGLQNSRGFRALKVWAALQQLGRKGYTQMISKDIEHAQLLFSEAQKHPELEAVSQNLSITNLRYVPISYDPNEIEMEGYLNSLNETLLNNLQKQGNVFLSNAVVNGKYCLRACIVNYRTNAKDINEVVDMIVTEGRNIQYLFEME